MTETGTPQTPQAQAVAQSPRVFADALCAVDGTRRSFTAVEQAAALVGPQGRLALLAVTATRGSGQYSQAAISPKRAERVLEHAARIARHAHVPYTSTIDPSSPAPDVVMASALAHDLLALGAPSGSWLAGMLIDGVAHSAVRSLSSPLLAARPLAGGDHRFADRVIVASDGLDGSDELVEIAGRLACEQGAGVTLLHAVGVESRAHPHRVQEQVRRLELLVGGASEVRVEAGEAAEGIVHTARETSASLVVMGSRRLSGLRAIGSVSGRVLHDAPCSVLLFPPERLRGD